MSGSPNAIMSYQVGDHRCLMDIFYKKYSSDHPNTEKLIDFLKYVNVKEIIDFTTQTVLDVLSPWTPIPESVCNAFSLY